MHLGNVNFQIIDISVKVKFIDVLKDFHGCYFVQDFVFEAIERLRIISSYHDLVA